LTFTTVYGIVPDVLILIKIYFYLGKIMKPDVIPVGLLVLPIDFVSLLETMVRKY